MKVAVLIPCLNEEQTIIQVINSFKKKLPLAEIYVYDNNSDDSTYELALQNNIHVKKHLKRGKTNVVLEMFSDINADIYIIVDGDDTYPASAANDMIKVLVEKQADMVVGDRLSNHSYKKENNRLFHNFGNQLIKKLINNTFKASLNDILSGYRVFSKRFVKNYISTSEGFELETDLTLFALNYKLNIEEFSIDYRDRPEGSESKLNTFSDGKRVIIAFFNLLKDYKPFYFFSRIGLISLFFSLLFGFFPVMEYLQYQFVYKVPSFIFSCFLLIISFILILSGLILESINSFDKKKVLHKILHYEK